MDNKRPPISPTPNANPRVAGSRNVVQSPDQLPRSAAEIGQHQSYDDQLPQNAYPSMSSHSNFYANLMSAQVSPLNFSWNLLPTQHAPSHYPQSFSMDSSNLPFTSPLGRTDVDVAQKTTTGQQHPAIQSSAAGSSTTVIPPDVEQTITEEKRHRNTAASARFRIKKKHKNIVLERSVYDLTNRADELQREVAELRRENGWLKEIVMLKGAQYAANNPVNQEALRRAAAMAGPSLGSAGEKDRYRNEEGNNGDTESDEDPDCKGKETESAKGTNGI